MIEAVNKTLKYRHLFPFPMPLSKDLEPKLQQEIPQYNSRPHSKLKTLTPDEVHSGVIFDPKKHRDILNQARVIRMEINRKACPPCLPLILEEPENQKKEDKSSEA